MSTEQAEKLGQRLGMSAEALREQMILFAYANAHMENPAITLEMARQIAENCDARA